MILCSHDCIPCCDFCIYAFHDFFEQNGEYHKSGTMACLLHRDQKHQDIADGCGHCEDYHCILADKEEVK